jgi:anti-anti-sigma factor
MCHSLDPDAAHADSECRGEPDPLSPCLQPPGAPNACVVRLAGSLDSGARPALERALSQLSESPPKAHLVLDLSRVTSVDAEGLVLLERLRRRIEERGGCLKLAGSSPAIRQSLEATGLIYFHRGPPSGGRRREGRPKP